MKALRTSSKNILRSKYLAGLLIIFLLISSISTAQKLGQAPRDFNTTAENTLKDVTATGPFPFYISLRPYTMLSIGDQDIRRMFDTHNAIRATPVDAHRNAWGYSLDGGAKLFRTLLIEVNYTQMLRSSGNNETRLRISQRSAGFRVGGAFGIYYPLSLQFCTGFLVNTSDFTLLESSGGIENKRKLAFSESLLKGRFGGDFVARIMFMDPVGAGGGLGFFIELRQVVFDSRLNYQPFVTALDPSATNQFVSDANCKYFSIGFTAPLALRSHIGE